MARRVAALGLATLVLIPGGPGIRADAWADRRPVRPAPAVQAPTDDRRLRALELAYNLDHDPAIDLLRQAIAANPSDPAPHRTLAAVLWLNMLFKRGAVTVDHYLGSFSRARVDLKKPPPELEADFKRHVRYAIDLSEARLETAPRNAAAHYDLGAALGLDASYIATVEGRMLAGFRAARRSYDLHEQVLELDPSRHDAGVVVGTYRYIVATLSLPMRMMAYVAGFGGGKDRGIEMLKRAAAGGGEAKTDALFALALVYNREKRYDEALAALRQLRTMYPRNRLVLLEEGSTALRGGRFAEAEAILTDGMMMLSREKRERIPGEDALWRYKRGAARAGLGRDNALEDLQAATGPDAQSWVSGRARVEIGTLAMKRGDRTAAAAEAQQAENLCQTGNDPVCLADARKLLRSARGR